ncbi:OLC1v1020428C1 [Oldenlandia corymbosa var. corymbosa]|uniref:OLC1v1020428C1 n=1 Tax=Oldenlandia corymbosa var. corymbosa TaxID=529605 RepID=A0AAV1EGF4_OLDCO|nr:OLC1v1020428C1 [Oldenlandia corymbosa var. corymbosa]
MRHCVIEKDGLLEVSGFVDPDLLVKALGKAKSKMELKWLQFGKCSTNLFGPDRRQFMMIQPAAPPPPVITPAPPSPLQATGFGYPPGARYPYRHDGRLYGSDIHPYYDGNEGCHIM